MNGNLEEKIRQSKLQYDSVEMPRELQDAVMAAVKSAGGPEKDVRTMIRRGMKTGIAAAMAVLVCFAAGLNASPVFAGVMKDIPVIGTVSRFLTFRTYDYQDQDKTIHEVIPQIQGVEGADDRRESAKGADTAGLYTAGEQTAGSYASGGQTGGSYTAGPDPANSAEPSLEQTVNGEISRIMEQYREDAQTRIGEYKKAFLATGGTAEEFSQKGIRIDAGYEIYHETEEELSFVITANENWSGAYGIRLYYNLDLKNGNRISLKNLLGEDYVELANRSVKMQMKERMEQNPGMVYWGDDMGGFTSIDDSTNFYINENGNPVLVFDKYEIAPGAYGIQEFEIQP